MSALFPPIPPAIDRGAGVEAEPTSTEVLKSEESIKFPVPSGIIDRLVLDSVPMVALLPAPRLSSVAEIPRVEEEVIVARLEEVRVVRSPAVRVVTPDRANEAFVVRVPREVALMLVALLAFIVVEDRLVVLLLILSIPVPLLGVISIPTVVPPPRVRVLF